MKKFLLASIVFAAAATPATHAVQFEGLTQHIDDPSIVYSIMPGTYSELKGSFDFDCQNYFVATYNQMGVLLNKQYWIIDENNEIVYDGKGKLKLYGIGMRNFNWFGVTLTGDEVTAEGTYYFVIATNTPTIEGDNAKLTSDGSMTHIENIMFGPYRIGEVKDPVDAQISVLPEGDIDTSYFDVDPESDDLPSITISITNGATVALLDISESVSLTDPAGDQVSLTMTSNVGGVITLSFNTGYTPIPGEYTLTVDYSTFNGFTTDDEPLRFPTGVQTYKFKVISDITLTDMEARIAPLPGVYEEFFTDEYLTIVPTNYRPSVADGWPEQLAVLCPDLNVRYLEAKDRTVSRGARYIIPEGFFSEYGQYIVRIDFGGLYATAAGSATAGTTAYLGILEFSYSFNDPNARPEAPAPIIEGAEVIDGNVEIPYRSSVSISFSDVENCMTYYKWNDGEETQYTEPIVISEAGTLTYLSRTSDGKESEPETLTFTIEEVELTPITLATASFRPGEYDALPVFTTLSIMPKDYKPKNYATDYPSAFLTKPSGDVIELTVIQTSNSRGVQYNVPVNTFDEWGTYTLRIDFNGCEGIPASSATVGTTAYMGVMELTYVFTEPIIPEMTTVAVEGSEIIDGNVVIPYGKSAILTFEASDNADIYVKIGDSEETLYTEPIEISEVCTVTYYAKLGKYTSETYTLTFTIGERPEPTLPEGITIIPDPNLLLKRVEGISITFGDNIVEGFTGFSRENVKGTASVHDFATDEVLSTANVLYSSANVIFVPVVIRDNGKYLVDIDLTETMCNIGEVTSALPEALQHIYVVYNIDIIMAIDSIAADSDDAEYYTIEGIRIDRPQGKGIFIKRAGGKSSLIIVK